MGAFTHLALVAALGLLSAATAQANPALGAAAAPAAKQPQAPALPPMSNRAPAMRQAAWVQREGYVPVPETLTRPATPAADPDALPPANQWATIEEKPFANDPTGTNVYADTKYAPAAVRAAFEAQDDEPALDPTTSVFAPKPNPVGGMSGGMAGAGTASSQSAMLQQSFGPTSPAGAAPSDAIFVGGNSAGAGAGAGAGGGAGPTGDVFTGGNNAFNNKYTPSVGNAMGSSDMLVSMIVDAPEQTTALGSDAMRSIMGRLVNVFPNRIFVYQTRTINNPKGQPSTAVTYLIKNTVDPERSRQQSTFNSVDIMNGFMSDVAKATKLRITPGTIKATTAVNDGSRGGAAAGAMPGQMPAGPMLGGAPGGQMAMPGGQMGMPGQMAPGNGMMMPTVGAQAGVPGAAAAAPAAPVPPAKSSANGSTAGVLMAAAVLLAAVVVF